MTDVTMLAAAQWANRPSDERFVSLTEMHAKLLADRAITRARVVSSRDVLVRPAGDPQHKGLVVSGRQGGEYTPTHWAFGQLASLVGAPAAYLRTLPSSMAADCINYGLQVNRGPEDIGVMFNAGSAPTLRAATGPRYGRIWNVDVVGELIRHVGDGVTGRFTVPQESKWTGLKAASERPPITKQSTTLYAGDRDMWVFLADEHNRIELPNRRGGRSGTLARGVIIRNSEVGSSSLEVLTFLFDAMCCNHIIWGATKAQTVSIRHTASAPDKYIEQVQPALIAYANASTDGIVECLKRAQAAKIQTDITEFLAKRFGPRVGARVAAAHEADEGRPIETVWDVVTGATAYARDAFTDQGDRFAFERDASALLDEVNG